MMGWKILSAMLSRTAMTFINQYQKDVQRIQTAHQVNQSDFFHSYKCICSTDVFIQHIYNGHINKMKKSKTKTHITVTWC